MPSYAMVGSGIVYTCVPEEATNFVTIECAALVARELSLEETIEVVPVLV